jgi:hypothetical protein
MVITSEWVGDITIGTVTYDCGMVGLHQLRRVANGHCR